MRRMQAGELKSKLEAGEAVELVDIREADEYAQWHIPGSRNLPVYEDLKADRDEALVRASGSLPKGRPIVTICRAGVMSEHAAEILDGLGYDARSLEGGMRGWGVVWTEAPIEGLARRDAVALQIRRNGKGCLSYLLGAGGQALVIDPSVDVEAYVAIATREGLRLTHVLETHVHADHLSRARALCAATGAELVLPENRRVNYRYTPLRDGDRRVLAGLGIEVLATPGHTSESACYLVEETLLFTGDTLFVDSVGRPDLERGDAGAESGAHQLHQSLHERLLRRVDDVRFFPAHHARPIGFDRTPIGGSLADARRRLDLLRADEREFVRRVLASLKAKPGNFDAIIAINEGRATLGDESELDLEAGPNSCAAG